MTEAIFGLAGVIIGGLLNGGITYLADARQRRRVFRQACRLAADEFSRMALIAEISRDRTGEGQPSEADHVDLMLRRPAQSVRRYIETLADRLDYASFRVVANALQDAEGMAERFYGDASAEWNEVHELLARARDTLTAHA